MRLIELHDLWDRFNTIIDNPRLDSSVKQVLAGEILNLLPPVMLCGSFSLSRVLVEEDMKGRLADLKERNGRREEAGGSSSRRKETSKAEEEVPAKPKYGKK